jgi:hypothetical protein
MAMKLILLLSLITVFISCDVVHEELQSRSIAQQAIMAEENIENEIGEVEEESSSDDQVIFRAQKVSGLAGSNTESYRYSCRLTEGYMLQVREEPGLNQAKSTEIDPQIPDDEWEYMVSIAEELREDSLIDTGNEAPLDGTNTNRYVTVGDRSELNFSQYRSSILIRTIDNPGVEELDLLIKKYCGF